MIISGNESNTRNGSCEDIYNILIQEIQEYINRNNTSKREKTISTSEQKNPFTEACADEDSVETFVPLGGLKSQIKEAVENVCEKMPLFDVTRFLAIIHLIKQEAAEKNTKFNFRADNFVAFLKAYYSSAKVNLSPKENLIQMLEIDKNREIVKPFAFKFFKVLFYLQKPKNLNFYEISSMMNFAKVNFPDDLYLQTVTRFAIKEYVVLITKKYTCNTLIRMSKLQCRHFCAVTEKLINAFNGTIIELETEASELSKVLFTILMFYLNKEDSIFMKHFNVKELFYCSLRSVYQGNKFAKKLECLIASKLKWKLLTDSEEFTIDKVYQTIFKKEYLELIGRIVSGNEDIYSQIIRNNENSIDLDSPEDKNQRVMVTKVIQTTPKTNRAGEQYAFSPLSRRIGERVKQTESLNSKRKLKFDE